jgi:hypothetical protein
MSAMKNAYHTEVLRQAAIEAAQSARDAFGAGDEPPAEVAYDFVMNLWLDTDHELADHLPSSMPFRFALDYALAVCGLISE